MQIIHFLLDHRIGGPHVYTKELVNNLCGRVSSKIVTTGKGAITDISLINLRHYWHPLYLIEIICNVLLILYRCCCSINSKNQTIFHVHGASNLAPLIAAWIARVPVLWLIHDTSPRFNFLVKFGKLFMRGNRKIIGVVAIKSKDVYRLDSAKFLPAAVSPSYWSYYGYAFSTSKHSQDLFPSDNYLKLVTVGNLNPVKGFDVLLQSLQGTTFPFHLRVIGASLATHNKYSQRLHHLAASIVNDATGSTIQFLGWQNSESIRELLAKCDIFILPSRSEACPIALLEAVSMRCQCVATDVGDVQLIIAGAIGSQLVKPGDPVSLRQGIDRAYHARNVGDVSNPGLDSKWHIHNLVSATFSIYKQLLAY